MFDYSNPALLFFNDMNSSIFYGFLIDLIAIPDSKLSGMENWGLITFRESALLLSNDESSTSDYLTVVKVVVHELSHMWFGNLGVFYFFLI